MGWIIVWVIYNILSLFLSLVSQLSCNKCSVWPLGSIEVILWNNIDLIAIDLFITLFLIYCFIRFFSKRVQTNSGFINLVIAMIVTHFVRSIAGWIWLAYLLSRCHNDCFKAPYYPVFEEVTMYVWVISGTMFYILAIMIMSHAGRK